MSFEGHGAGEPTAVHETQAKAAVQWRSIDSNMIGIELESTPSVKKALILT